MKKITSSQLTARLANLTKPLLIKFEASWCGPCKKFAPEVEAAEVQLAGTVDVVAVDIDDARDQAQKYGIRTVPTLVLIGVDGAELSRMQGLTKAATVIRWVRGF